MQVQQDGSAKGQAGIFGGSINSVQYYLQNSAAHQRQRALADQQAKADRDKAIDDIRKYNPDKAWEPFAATVNDYTQKNLRQTTNAMFDQGIPSNKILREADRIKGDIGVIVAKSNGLKDTYNGLLDGVKDDPYIADKDYYKRKINDWRDEAVAKAAKGDFQSISDDDIKGVLADPEGWDRQKIVTDQMKALPDLVTQKQKAIANITKEGYDEVKTKTKLGFQEDGKGGWVMDTRTGLPAIHMTDDVFQTSMENPRLVALMDHDLKKQGITDPTQQQQKDWMTKAMTPYDPKMLTHSLTNMTKIAKEGAAGSGDGPADPVERFKNNEAIVNDIRPDLLASTFDPYQPHQVEYVNPEGQVVTDVQNSGGTKIYLDAEGKRVAKPTKIRVAFTKGGLTDDLSVLAVTMDGSLSDAEREKKLKALAIQQGKLNTKEFDISTQGGKRAVHHVLNRLLDEYLPPKARLAEGYTKIVNDHYDNQKGGVY